MFSSLGRKTRWTLVDATADANILLATRGIRAFGDGFTSVLLPIYLSTLGFTAGKIGLVATSTMLGSAAVTLLVGLLAYRFPRKQLLIRAALLMFATGVAFALVHDFWPLVAVAFCGTLNTSSGDVSVFLPTEQALLPQTISLESRTALFGRYAMTGSLIAATGALFAGFPDWVNKHSEIGLQTAYSGMFMVYAMLGILCMRLYMNLSPAIEPDLSQVKTPLGPSKGHVYKLAALFSIDSFAGGFVVQSLLSLWLYQKFDLSAAQAGTIFFVYGVLAAFSVPVSVRLAKRIGIINTCVFTHLPANLLLIATAFMPTLPFALMCLFGRAFLSNMDVPVRNSFVMSVVTPEERPAAASITNVPRSLAAALGTAPSGFLLGMSTFGWPLLIAGTLKSCYDLLLLAAFRNTGLRDD